MKLEDYINKLPYIYSNMCNLSKKIEEFSLTKSIANNVKTYNDLLLVENPDLYQFAYVRESQGVQWLPSGIGGTYYSSGLYMWNGTQWIKDDISVFIQLQQLIDKVTILEQQSTGSELSLETIAISSDNQTVNIQNANQIIGFSLISSISSLSVSNGRISGTWIINDNREKIRCYMETFDDPFNKLLICTCEINNTNNTFIISNKHARYYDVRLALPQSTMIIDVPNYKLEKLILIKKTN